MHWQRPWLLWSPKHITLLLHRTGQSLQEPVPASTRRSPKKCCWLGPYSNTGIAVRMPILQWMNIFNSCTLELGLFASCRAAPKLWQYISHFLPRTVRKSLCLLLSEAAVDYFSAHSFQPGKEWTLLPSLCTHSSVTKQQPAPSSELLKVICLFFFLGWR